MSAIIGATISSIGLAMEEEASSIMSSDPCELTILMPCLNEAETIQSCIRKARQFIDETGIAAEVLVADNGSSDDSRALAAAAGARLVSVANRGYGAALIAGIDAARGRYVIGLSRSSRSCGKVMIWS